MAPRSGGLAAVTSPPWATTISRTMASPSPDPAHVVNQVGQQRHAAGGHEDRRLGDGGDQQRRQAERDCPQPLARLGDRAVDEPMAVAVGGCVVDVLVHALTDRGSDRARGGLAEVAGDPEADVLDMRHRLGKQLADVVVVQLVDDLAPVALTHDQTEMAQYPQLM